MWEEPPPLFPDWFGPADVRRHFVVTRDAADVVVMTLSYHLTVDDLERLVDSFPEGKPVVVIYTLDDLEEPARGGWDRSPEWAEAIRGFALSADLLAGPQIPRALRSGSLLPLPYGPVVPFAPEPRQSHVCDASVDVYFSGAWYPHGGAKPNDSRDRRYRGYLVARLQAQSGRFKLKLDRVHYWRRNPLDPGQPVSAPVDKRALLAAHAASLDTTKIALAPAGHAWYTARHSDILARGAVLLSERVHEKVHLPEPRRWADGELSLFYDPGRDDIIEVIVEALADRDRLESLSLAGWRYGQAHLRADRQAQRLADAVRALLDG